MAAIRRIKSELRSLCDEKQVIVMVPDPMDLQNLRGIVISPPGAPTEGFIFFVDIRIPEQYPFKPPQIEFANAVWHPKIGQVGGWVRTPRRSFVCLPAISLINWKPATRLYTILLTMQDMLRDPGDDVTKEGPIFNAEAAKQYLHDRAFYVRTAKEWARKDNEGYGLVTFENYRISAIQSVLRVPGVIGYEGQVFCNKDDRCTWMVTLVIIPGLALYREGVEQLYPITSHQYLKLTRFDFSFYKDTEITLKVGKGVSLDECWKIEVVGADKVVKSDADRYVPRQNTPAVCKLKLVWIHEEKEPQRLIHNICMVGAVSQFNSFDICINPKDYVHGEVLCPLRCSERPTLQQLLKCPVKGERKHVSIPSEIGSRYSEFGVFLLNDSTGNIVDSIVKENRGNIADINREIFRRWLTGQGKKPVTWKILADVLCDVHLNELANDIQVMD